MQKSETIGELAKALSIVQSKLEGAKKDSVNPFFKMKYADLSSVWDACRKPLSENGLAVVQTNTLIEDKVIVDTTLIHSSGEWISGQLALTPTKTDPQGMGSAITYGRRYGLSAIIGISPEDDDAEGATNRIETPKETPKQKPAKVDPNIQKLKDYTKALGWKQEDFDKHLKAIYHKDRFNELSPEEASILIAELSAMVDMKYAGKEE